MSHRDQELARDNLDDGIDLSLIDRHRQKRTWQRFRILVQKQGYYVRRHHLDASDEYEFSISDIGMRPSESAKWTERAYSSREI